MLMNECKEVNSLDLLKLYKKWNSEIQDEKNKKQDIAIKEDRVNHPSHYNTGDIEVISYIKDKLTNEEYNGYCIGNVLKYVSRYKHKNGKEDLDKANVYLDWAIEVM